MGRFKLMLMWVWVFCGVVGCAVGQGGSATFNAPGLGSGYVVQPADAKTPARIVMKLADGSSLSITTGIPRKPDVAMKSVWIIYVAGVGLVVLGGLLLFLRFWRFPSIPVSGSLGVVGVGVMLLFMPKIVQEAWWVVLVMGVLVAGIYAVGQWTNRRQAKKSVFINTAEKAETTQVPIGVVAT